MKRKWRFEAWDGLLVAAIIFCVFGAYMAYQQSDSFTEDCTEAGGIPFRGKSGLICIDPSALKRVNPGRSP